MIKQLTPLRGFRDLYPQDKATQIYIFDTLQKTAQMFGFEQYEGPILEPIDLYLDKSSRELIEQQTFHLIDKHTQTILLRPEMTPSLARMIASKGSEMIFPARLFNLGLRFRYETPQKAREREFYQADFDLIGITNVMADAEILRVLISIFTSFGATEKDFIIYINSRSLMQQELTQLGISEKHFKEIISIIDKREKISDETFRSLLAEKTLGHSTIERLIHFLDHSTSYHAYFKELYAICDRFDISKYLQINLSTVRGLDYYTGLVLEVKEKGEMTRALAGGGRYDHLISSFNPSLALPGVGFATSDVVLEAFLKNKNLIPHDLKTHHIKALITVFPEDALSRDYSLQMAKLLHDHHILTELYPDEHTRIDKQLKYGDRKGIPYTLIAGPDEVRNHTVIVKTMATGEQKKMKLDELTNILLSS